ncbi:nitroreductase family protein [Nonlabens xiamenensis]|uniref:nitroreductase family protein n=1 Tax=Nonlabens xiamenensis TaxID=2341043 RepID=UPI000F614506|nr:nitroreductase [Nonlabens xiamenensis]
MINDLLQLIQTRRSVFPAQYTQGEISSSDLHKILESARWAPNHRKTEPWRYKVLQGEALTSLGDFMEEQFMASTGKPTSYKIKKLKTNLEASSAVCLIFMHRDEQEAVPEWEEVAATAMSVQNMWLTCHALGHGCYWSSPKSYADMSQYDRISVDDRERFLGFFFLGTFDEAPDHQLPAR